MMGPAWLEYERRARRASWWDVWFDVLTLVAVIALLGYGLMDTEGFLRWIGLPTVRALTESK